jgi:RNA polymerase sigma-70 factor (ECF subfamily)
MNAIKQLKTDYQDVVIMRFVDDLSVREVANILNKSEGSIKLMQHRAIKKLKEIFEK